MTRRSPPSRGCRRRAHRGPGDPDGGRPRSRPGFEGEHQAAAGSSSNGQASGGQTNSAPAQAFVEYVVTSARQPGESELERRIDLFGTEVRILVGAPTPRHAQGNQVGVIAVEELLRRHHRSHPVRARQRAQPAQRRRARSSDLGMLAGGAAGGPGPPSQAAVWWTRLLGALERAGYGSSGWGSRPRPREALPGSRRAAPHAGGRLRTGTRSRSLTASFAGPPACASTSAGARRASPPTWQPPGSVVSRLRRRRRRRHRPRRHAAAPRVVVVEHPLGHQTCIFPSRPGRSPPVAWRPGSGARRRGSRIT